jgi:hypothetical protein
VPPGTAFHTPEFARAMAEPMAMAALVDSAKAIAMTAIDLFCDPGLCAAVADEHARATRAA